MTLEDFFTLTEMKNGLTTCGRVEELICVMQKWNCVTNNVGDAARQWSTVASTLACTKSRECLSLFVHLNGLGFLNHWLQEAVKCSIDIVDGEELINTLIESLEKLPTNPEKLSSSGIFATVEKLLGHKNANINERARMLFDKWNNDNECQEMEKNGSCHVDSCTPSVEFKHAVDEVVDKSSRQTTDEESHEVDSSLIQNLSVMSDNDFQLGDVDDRKYSTTNQTLPVIASAKNDVSDAGQENYAVEEGNFIPKSEIAFPPTTSSPKIHVKDDDPCNISVRDDVMAEVNERKSDSWEVRANPKVVRSASCTLTLNKGNLDRSDGKEVIHRCASVDGVWTEYLKTMGVKSGEHDSSSWKREATENSGDAENSGDSDPCNEDPSRTCEGVDTFIYEEPSKTSNDQVIREMEKSSDSEAESGEMDALEIARLVAIEVEREVVDYREELCSSSSESSSNEVINNASPIKDDCDVTSPPKNDDRMVVETATDPSKQDQSPEFQNEAAVIQDSRARTEMRKFDFDLNEDACTEDIDCAVDPINPSILMNLSAPIAVSASKGAPSFLITPLCLEGGLGWRGSAATSAFRPASPRRTSDGEKSESGSKYKPNLIEFDLNVTDSGNYLPLDTIAVPVSSGIPSWNSSSEVSSLKPERIKLDLNNNGEDQATPSHSLLVKPYFVSSGQTSSPASSSSRKQPPHKHFDLNDNLFSSDAAVSKHINLSKAENPHGVRTDEPIITIMGSRMSTADRRIHPNPTHPSCIPNGLNFDLTLPTGPILPYPPHPNYGYIAPGTGMAVPFPPAGDGAAQPKEALHLTIGFLFNMTGSLRKH
ncbi:uncharacterized protein LOC110027119 [Phalaenopsis equestris]|uniref:uncharacterized protein LOC110027119 n=1 Tax=Phalaenopsis equestris TaxID=78828 RepID=UPI0009E27E85|nr:uncharacterized protein LOC110027119 [Phalaenopsis equestris]